MLIKSRRALTLAVLLALISMILGLFLSKKMHQVKPLDPSLFHGTVLKNPRTLENFSLQGMDSKSFNNQTLKGKWTLVFFGFTSCGYLCPTTMAELAKMMQILTKQNLKSLPQVVMVSIDPERDTPEKLAQYLKAFNPQFYGAYGSKEAIKQLSRDLGVVYARVNLPGKEAYDIQHSGTVILINPAGEVAGFFTTPHQADWLAEDYARLVA